MSVQRCDVVVVGARAAGSATAMLLARAGLDVIVVDRSRRGADTLSTHALLRGGVIQLHRWGLLDRIKEAGTPAVRRTTFHRSATSTVVDIRPGHGVDALYAPRRTVLDPVLADGAAASGAHVRFGFTVTDVVRDADGRACGVVGAGDDGRPTTIRARLVVGADGLRSVVAARAEAPVERYGRGAGHYVYRYWSEVDADGYEWVFTPDGTAGLIPTNDGLTCVFVGSTAGGIADRRSGGFAGLLRRASGPVAARVLAGRPEGRPRRFPGRPGLMRRPWGPGWALVGDAGYWKDPISAHGLTDALRDAELLAGAVVRGLGSADAAEEEHWMRGYHELRNHLSTDLFDITDRLATPGWTDDDIEDLLRSMSAAMEDEVSVLAGLPPWPPVAVAKGVGCR